MDSEYFCSPSVVPFYFYFVIRSGEKVEKCIDVYLKTPGLPKEDVTKALLAREDAWQRLSGSEPLFAKAQQGYFYLCDVAFQLNGRTRRSCTGKQSVRLQRSEFYTAVSIFLKTA